MRTFIVALITTAVLLWMMGTFNMPINIVLILLALAAGMAVGHLSTSRHKRERLTAAESA